MTCKRRKLKCGGRPKAFWGAVIGAAASLIGAGISAATTSNAQKRAQQAQEEEQRRQNKFNRVNANANSLNNYFASVNDLGNEEDRYVYKCGGRRKLKNGARITDGGVAIPVGNGISLLRGSSHEDINEKGKTGIGIKTSSGAEIEAENNEAIRSKNGNLYVYSAQPMLPNGESPAEAVVNGANPDVVFALQEKAKKHLSSPVKKDRTKALLGLSVTGGDLIGLGADLLSSIGVGLINRNANKNLNYDYVTPEYYEETPVSLNTRYYNAAQRANVERNREQVRRNISRNTASSNVAVGRMNEADTNAIQALNELWDVKANKEAELRNENARLQQEVRARNAAARNAWAERVANVRNAKIDAENAAAQRRGEAWSATLSGLGTAVSNFLDQTRQRYVDENAIAARIAASKDGNLEQFIERGGQLSPRIIANAYRRLSSMLPENVEKPDIKNYYNNGDFDGDKYITDMFNYNTDLSKYNSDNKVTYDKLNLLYNSLSDKQRKRYKLSKVPGMV